MKKKPITERKYRVVLFFGTRPEAVKMAPVVEEMRKIKQLEPIVVVSAQHRDMLDQVLRLFGLRPNADLNIMREGQSLFDITSQAIKKLEHTLEKIRPHLMLVHGDTTTTLAGALSGYYKRIPIGHVEAGLRTHDKYRPFPEEINRRLTDGLSTLHFAPTAQSAENLRRENLPNRYIFVTGNTVIDALLEVARKPGAVQSDQLRSLLPSLLRRKAKIVLMTAHRRENFGSPFENVCRAVLKLSHQFPNVHWIYPVHPNPNVKGPAHRWLGSLKNVHLLRPLEYGDLVRVLKVCKIVVTDSGGIQEEAPSLGKPVVVLRDVTERPEAVRAGTVSLVGTNQVKIINEVSRLITDFRYYRRIANRTNPYGDGQASKRICQAIMWYFGKRKNRPSAFRSRS